MYKDQKTEKTITGKYFIWKEDIISAKKKFHYLHHEIDKNQN